MHAAAPDITPKSGTGCRARTWALGFRVRVQRLGFKVGSASVGRHVAVTCAWDSVLRVIRWRIGSRVRAQCSVRGSRLRFRV